MPRWSRRRSKSLSSFRSVTPSGFGSKQVTESIAGPSLCIYRGPPPRLGFCVSLRERWDGSQKRPAPKGAVRPVAYEAMTDPMWAVLFDIYDPGVTRVPVEVRHPFFDVRLVNFLLALPALPWCSDKQLLRKTANG